MMIIELIALLILFNVAVVILLLWASRMPRIVPDEYEEPLGDYPHVDRTENRP